MKFFKILLSIIFFSIFINNSYSQVDIDVDSIIVHDHHSGQILFERNADERIYPASMTKIMTAIVTFDLLKKG